MPTNEKSEKRQCSKCDLWKSIAEYYYENRRQRYAPSCKKCQIKTTMEWQKNNYKRYRKTATKAHRDWVKRRNAEFIRLKEENAKLNKINSL